MVIFVTRNRLFEPWGRMSRRGLQSRRELPAEEQLRMGYLRAQKTSRKPGRDHVAF